VSPDLIDVVDGRSVPRDGTFDHERYQQWEDEYIRSCGTYINTGKPCLHGRCAEGTLEARKAFPELARVRGHVRGRGDHWWCVAPDGTIIDPTRAQWNPIPDAEDYEFLDESTADRLPIGKCPGCGGFRYQGSSGVCSAECALAMCEDMGIAFDPAAHAGSYGEYRGEATYFPNPGFVLPPWSTK
jgi:hypothetical protein